MALGGLGMRVIQCKVTARNCDALAFTPCRINSSRTLHQYVTCRRRCSTLCRSYGTANRQNVDSAPPHFSYELQYRYAPQDPHEKSMSLSAVFRSISTRSHESNTSTCSIGQRQNNFHKQTQLKQSQRSRRKAEREQSAWRELRCAAKNESKLTTTAAQR